MDLKFARCQIHALSPFGVYKPLLSENILTSKYSQFTVIIIYYYIYTTKNIFQFSSYSPCHYYMRAWIRVLEAPGCYERAALQGSGLVRTVGPCAQRSNVCTKKSSLDASGPRLQLWRRIVDRTIGRAFRKAC